MYPISQLLHCFSTRRARPEKGLAWRSRHAFRKTVSSCLLGLAAFCSAHAQALLPGKAVAWGIYIDQNIPAQVPAEISDVAAIAGGMAHDVALKKDGTVVAWGGNSVGQTNVPSDLSGVVAISVNEASNLALKSDGTVVPWGSNFLGQLDVPAGLNNVVAISLGANHALALKADGTVVAWGNNECGQSTIPDGLSGMIAIAAAGSYNLALRADHTLVAWGGTCEWPPLNGASTVPTALIGQKLKAIAAGDQHSLALKEDGTVFAWGVEDLGNTVVPSGLSNVVAIAAGKVHSIALKGDGTVVAWGNNINGQAAVPSGLSGVNSIGAGAYHTLAANAVPLTKPYTLSGFLSPVNNPPAVNLAKSGKTYPLKWQLKDSSRAWVGALSAITSLNYQPVQCGQFTGNLNEIAEVPLDAAGESALRYDDLANQYLFNWKAPAAGCYVVSIGLDTGQSFSANFNIGK